MVQKALLILKVVNVPVQSGIAYSQCTSAVCDCTRTCCHRPTHPNDTYGIHYFNLILKVKDEVITK